MSAIAPIKALTLQLNFSATSSWIIAGALLDVIQAGRKVMLRYEE
jgi:hypothetical protein